MYVAVQWLEDPSWLKGHSVRRGLAEQMHIAFAPLSKELRELSVLDAADTLTDTMRRRHSHVLILTVRFQH